MRVDSLMLRQVEPLGRNGSLASQHEAVAEEGDDHRVEAFISLMYRLFCVPGGTAAKGN